MIGFEQDIQRCLEVLQGGGLILYPTDTVWAIGCDATNEAAVAGLRALKQIASGQGLVVILAAERAVLQYVAAADLTFFDAMAEQAEPATMVFDHALGLADNVLHADGSIAIRLVRDEFCRHLVKRFRKPIVSTTANISGAPTPLNFQEIAAEIQNGVDYTVRWQQKELTHGRPSAIFRWDNGRLKRIR